MVVSRWFAVVLGAHFVFGASDPLVAQQPDHSRNADLQRTYRSKASEPSFALANEASTPLVLVQDPVMTWTSVGGWSGDVFAWTAGGRIQMVGCIGSQVRDDGTVHIFQEFHSLVDEPSLDAKLGPTQVWNIPTYGSSLKPIPGAPTPADTPTRRLIQMRQLARSFRMGMRVTSDEVENDMRLLTQPLVRETGGNEVIDSALFTFVSSSGTDPEAFLLIEARKIDSDPVWTYMPARFTTREIWMTRDQQEVWRALPFEGVRAGTPISKPYFYRDESTVTLDELASNAD